MTPSANVAFILFSTLCLPLAALAQPPASSDDGPPDQAGAGLSDSIQLVFEREVFTYPTFERRNPFRALTGEEASGPRFEDLILLGVVLSQRSESSIAVLGARPPGATSDQPATRVYRLRSGQSIGNVRVLEIRRREVLFAVEDLGTSETRTLAMQPPGAVPPPPPLVPPPDDGPPEAAPAPEDPGSAPEPAGGVALPQGTAAPGARLLPRQAGEAEWSLTPSEPRGPPPPGGWT